MSSPRETSRRDFLKFAGLGGVALGAAAVPALGAAPREAAVNLRAAQAKNVIFLVADGMNLAALSLADAWSRRTRSMSSRWMRLYQERPVVRSLCETHSATGLVTDSAAAASAWGIGERIANGVLNITPDGRKPVTLAQKMMAARKRVGLVTTATATHATPAGFAVTVASRKNQAEVAAQAASIAEHILRELDYVGVITLEFFEKEGRLLLNEIAPRVHNSGHWSIEGSQTSQFENHLRAVLGWPLGSTRPVGCSALLNIIGTLPDTTGILGLPDTHLHLYGKEPRRGRKLGHVTARADDRTTLENRIRALEQMIEGAATPRGTEGGP